MSEWKLGDVGITGNKYGGETPTVFLVIEDVTGKRRFVYADGDSAGFPPREDARPLVVIDPEDREQAERFTHTFLSHHWSADYQAHTDAGQAALREFANPTLPRPEEPQGLGAVVEDANGALWTRVESGVAETRNPWYPAAFPDLQPDEYDHIAVVKVLSEGWSE